MTIEVADHLHVLGLWVRRWNESQSLLTYGQCDAAPMVAIASEHQRPSTTGTKLYRLVTEAAQVRA